MKKKCTVVVALVFVLAVSAAAQASELTLLANHSRQYDSVGKRTPVLPAGIFSMDEINDTPTHGGAFLRIIDRSMIRPTTPSSMNEAGNQAGRIALKGDEIFTIADRDTLYIPRLAPGGTVQVVPGGSLSLIGGDLNSRDISTISSSELPYPAGNITMRAGNLVVENGSEEPTLTANMSRPLDRPVLMLEVPVGSQGVELTAMDSSPVPLPAAISLLGSGLALLCIARRRNEEV